VGQAQAVRVGRCPMACRYILQRWRSLFHCRPSPPPPTRRKVWPDGGGGGCVCEGGQAECHGKACWRIWHAMALDPRLPQTVVCVGGRGAGSSGEVGVCSGRHTPPHVPQRCRWCRLHPGIRRACGEVAQFEGVLTTETSKPKPVWSAWLVHGWR